jgi:hypothetical protein
MKLVKIAGNKTIIKMSKSEWQTIGKQAGWFSKDKKPTIQQNPQDVENATTILANIKNITLDLMRLYDLGIEISIKEFIKKAELLYANFIKIHPYENKLNLDITQHTSDILPSLYEIIKHKNAPYKAISQMRFDEKTFHDFYKRVDAIADELKPQITTNANSKMNKIEKIAQFGKPPANTAKPTQPAKPGQAAKPGQVTQTQQNTAFMKELNPQIKKAITQALASSGLNRQKALPFLEQLLTALGDVPLSKVKETITSLTE